MRRPVEPPRLALIGMLCTFFVVTTAIPAPAASTVGIEGPLQGLEVTADGGSATGEKPESKLFITEDDVWWGALGLARDETPGVYLVRLDPDGWTPVLRLPESDPWHKADTSYDSATQKLIVSLRDVKPSTDANPRRSLLYRFAYDGEGGWTPVKAPTTITTSAPETLTVAKDTEGVIWVAFEQGRAIKVGYLRRRREAFRYLRLSAGDVSSDDVASVVAYRSGRIGVLWSDQVTDRFRFAWRTDGAPFRVGSFTRETAYGAGEHCPTATSDDCSDDHVNVKAVGGRIYVAVKTSLNDGTSVDPEDPLIVLLRRTSAGWEAFEVSDVEADFTRPIVVVDAVADQIYVLAHGLFENGDSYLWQTPEATPTFGDPVPWTTHDELTITNATSTKQPVSPGTGLVAVTSTTGAPHNYWYNVA